ncbi:MAG TPA: cysteine desulfurase [Polyangiaceae bacterium LLY-WYZ-15_(1-7)]|nr:cysteine desulfurase CsdA [Myxococcales bacterium]MBJ70917.1 cysteine desulfurase CsdA [Sandaracinus sp.]HJK94326.1 cysteine desulfurase [Polyangiaceae bacterium LLY-WYZ-15_(1-7)]HJL03913.1 cysteine desulfurase [Polyangiaceae bacterium LLY-WYZ-15_(1-7)]HJL07649.1 cysteine desulfurase [Polyangiaceae bacterium LLY-WYZ-15_(1-7)]
MSVTPEVAPSEAASSAAPASSSAPAFDVEAVRAQFPALQQEVHPGKPLVYLDSAATALKPQVVIDAVTEAYAKDCANVHRAVHALSQRATAKFEGARDSVRRFLNAEKREEIIFVRGCTEGINLVAQSWGRANLGPGDEILLTELEHHSNIVPWQLVAEEKGAKVVVVPMTDAGEITVEAFRAKLSERTKLAAFTHVSNALGTILPVAELTRLAHDAGAKVLVDGAQGVVHQRVDVRALDADFYVFSGHKLYAPSGIGVLYGKEALLEAMPPWQGGGDMIDRVTFEGSSWNDLPYKYEAGTPAIAQAIGLGAAIEWLEGLDWDGMIAHETAVLEHGAARLGELERLTLRGTAPEKASVLGFTLEGIHPTDAGTILDAQGVAIRTGHHCAQPVMDHFGVTATARASLGVYNTNEDIDALVSGLKKVESMFG